MVSVYNILDWYWFVVGDQTKAYSSDRNLYVATSDTAYQSWFTQGNRASNIDTVQTLFGIVQSVIPTSAQILQFGTTLAAKATLAELKFIKQAALDSLFNAHFDIAAFIRDGTSTSISAANVGTFMATITNNYRTIRATISAAATPSALNAIDINAGWPANP